MSYMAVGLEVPKMYQMSWGFCFYIKFKRIPISGLQTEEQTHTMIQHALKDDILSISIANKDFSYRISLKKLGNKCNWEIGDNDSEQIIVKGVSTWALQLFTKVVTELKYVEQFKVLVQEFCPKNSIHWEDTFMAVKIQNEYNSLTQKTNPTKDSNIDKELIAQLTDKYDLDY